MVWRSLTLIGMLLAGFLLGRYVGPQQPENGMIGDTHDHAGHAPYVCPMHPDVISEQAGTCPICGMALVRAKQSTQDKTTAHNPYVCPMHPDVISEQPGTCPICGMALVQKHNHAADTDDNTTDSKPTIRIHPDVVHNLGVRTAPVQRTHLVRRIETPGFVQQIQPGKIKRVTAPFNGRVSEILYQPGKWLEPGQPLMVLESDTLRDAQAAYLKQLPTDKAPSTTTPTDTTADLPQARRRLLQLGMTDADIELLEQQRKPSSRLTLVAPYALQASTPQINAGDAIRQGALLFELSAMARATVLANAFQRDAAWIRTGQPVAIHLPHVSGETWSGVVNQGAVSIDPTSQNIGVRLSFSAPGNLIKSGMYVLASISGEVREAALAVPREAIIHTEHEQRVVVALGQGKDQRRFKPVTVRTGIEADGQVEILSGLTEQDEVVVSAQFLLDSESSLQASFQRMSGMAYE